MVATILYALMYIVGFVSFLLPAFNEENKAKIVVFHIVGGTAPLVIGLAAAISGVLEKATFMGCVNDSAGCTIGNVGGLFLVLLILMLLSYYLLNINKRPIPPQPVVQTVVQQPA